MPTAMSLPPWRDATIVAYLDEPPFAISGRASERPSGCDMDLALHVLKGAGSGISASFGRHSTS